MAIFFHAYPAARGASLPSRSNRHTMSIGRLTLLIFIGLVLGIAAGYVCHTFFVQQSGPFAQLATLFPTIFLRLIKMIIAPLVVSTLTVGIARMGDIATVGRIAGKALGWFAFASLLSLTLGLILVGLLEPGKAMHLPLPAAAAAPDLAGEMLSLLGFIAPPIPLIRFV